MGAFFLKGEIPSGIGSQAGSAADVALVVPRDLGLEQGVGRREIGDFFIGAQGDQAFLEGVEPALNFAFSGGIRSNAVVNAQGAESTLELGMSVEAVGWGMMTEKREPVGVKAGW